ncbi:MAG TPA: nuclear transport factor 2 family protein, partial [Candidatus Binatia bacterium]
YRAFESLDIREMEKVWLREDYVRCIHPGWARISGWEDVLSSWRRIFENTQEMRFELTEVTIHVQGVLAWLTLYENISTRVEGETSRGIILTTNIFEKWQGRWWIIHHHGAPTVAPPSKPPSTLH